MAATRVEVQDVGEWKKVNPCTDVEGRRRIKVGSRWQVVVQVCEGPVSDGMWVRLTHAARFTDKVKAERLASRVRAAVKPDSLEGLDLAQWTWSPGPHNAFSALQSMSKAVEYDVN
jgi:hypothetical protein